MVASLTPPSPPSGVDDAATLRLRAEQLALLCKHSRAAATGAAVAALFVVWLLRAAEPVNLALWYALLLAVTALRLGLQQRYLNEQARDLVPINLSRYRLLILIGVGLYGAVWSVPSLWLLTDDPSAQIILTIFLVGLAATGIGSLAPVRYAYPIFITAFLAPIAVQAFTFGGAAASIGVGIVLFVFGMIVTAYRNSLTIEGSLRLILENADLAAREHAEKAVVERANRDLEAQIERRERTEAELRIAKAQAEAANRAKNQFLANMSHELRTPLNGVLGMAELLLRALPHNAANPKPLKYAQAIHAAGGRLLHLINDILDMARIEAGAIRFENATFDARRLIADAVETVADQCARKNLSLQTDIAPNVPRELRGDAYRLRQVLINLLANAVKFTEQGGIQIRLNFVEQEESRADRIRLRWSVVDSGIGIAPEARARLFQPFSQLDDSSTRRFGGSGLGLAICKQIITALGGTIDVESSPGVGSTFWFEVPLEISDHAATVRTTPMMAVRAFDGHVLIVEDNETNCQLIAEMLELAGCTTRTASNGIEALERLEGERFNAVLMDWHMPKLDGLAATRAWREREGARATARLPIVALTASVLPGDREACLQAGMDDFIAKPFTYDDLTEALARWLPKKVSQAL